MKKQTARLETVTPDSAKSLNATFTDGREVEHRRQA